MKTLSRYEMGEDPQLLRTMADPKSSLGYHGSKLKDPEELFKTFKPKVVKLRPQTTLGDSNRKKTITVGYI